MSEHDQSAGKRRALGRGLDSLLPPSPSGPTLSSIIPGAPIFELAVEELTPNRDQPRKHFDDKALDELAASLRSVGLLEPIVVRKSGGKYEIIAGERRWRAAQRAGLFRVPVYVRELQDEQVLEAAIIENIQREDLTPIETSRAYQRLIDEHGYTQEVLALKIGKDRSTITNALRLLKLPLTVIASIESGELTEGHGRALLGVSDEKEIEKLARAAYAKRWSVRETERRVRALGAAKHGASAGGAVSDANNPNRRALESRLSHALGEKTVVHDDGGKGRLEIMFSSYDALDRLVERLTSSR